MMPMERSLGCHHHHSQDYPFLLLFTQVKVDGCPPPGPLAFNADVYLQDTDGNLICDVALPSSLEVLHA